MSTVLATERPGVGMPATRRQTFGDHRASSAVGVRSTMYLGRAVHLLAPNWLSHLSLEPMLQFIIRYPCAGGRAMATANRLIHETSPYLRQHAHNPVDWYPWGPEALAKARAENRPIFLSIGYA